MKRTNISLPQLLEQGDIIRLVDDRNSGEVYHLPANLRDDFDSAFDAFREAFALCSNIRIDKEQLSEATRKSYYILRKTLNRLKRFIRVVADSKTASEMFHEFGIDNAYPTKYEDMTSLATGLILPKLDDWDGTAQEISSAMKDEVTTAIEDFASKSRANGVKQPASHVATSHRDDRLREYKAVLTRILNYLYLMLPDGKYDQRVEEYHFEKWDRPQSNKPAAPKNFAYDPETALWRWDAVDGEGVIYELVFRRRYTTGEWALLYKGPETQTANVPAVSFIGKYDFRVRALEGKHKGYWNGSPSGDMQ